ncbi:AraC family transcriptional regulator [Amaricoccus sp.]|uniref:AraC family transcriptional regulator n=1 Tax=Amaricoccus sp. TaxID=1872485 RepID=UPI001B5A7493|nr:AraC family transcriptional regulator [Amaricoccus sp.]MBP7001080.1 AraC family transcriptional regulator ligand-binding domain-containing protein [Amaricoccus sp.]
MISVTALAGVPALVRESFGEKVLQHANRAAMLDIELIEDRDCFIPHATMTAFLAEVERRSGEDVGLLCAPHLSLGTYGCWGEYVLGGATLGEATGRAAAGIGYHSRGDRAALSVRGGVARIAYLSAARGRPGYAHVATGAAGVIVNLCRSWAPPGWRPLGVELDIPRPAAPGRYEEAFGCAVRFDAPAIAVRFPASLLAAERAASAAGRRVLTLADVGRARLEPASRDDLMGVVTAHVWSQVLAGAVSLDAVAQAIDVSTRTLQRELRQRGTDFRSLRDAIRMQRARELLRGSGIPVTEIAAELGYSTPSNFARAFRKAVGVAPDAFR